ncbi:hypothetical protein AUP68_01019 [Ilyonectria robusta]
MSQITPFSYTTYLLGYLNSLNGLSLHRLPSDVYNRLNNVTLSTHLPHGRDYLDSFINYLMGACEYELVTMDPSPAGQAEYWDVIASHLSEICGADISVDVTSLLVECLYVGRLHYLVEREPLGIPDNVAVCSINIFTLRAMMVPNFLIESEILQDVEFPHHMLNSLIALTLQRIEALGDYVEHVGQRFTDLRIE